MENAFFKRAKF